MVTPKGYKEAVQSLWDGKAAITVRDGVRDGVLDERTGRTEPVERVLAEGKACRISYTAVAATEPSEEAARVVQSATLYIDPSVDIPEGSKITVTQKKVTRDYERSGTPAVYSAHQEVPLKLWEGWA